MSRNEAKFHATIPKNLVNRFNTTKKRLNSEFSVYSIDDFNRFILFDDGVFVFLIKNESEDILISSNEEFNITLHSGDKDMFTVDFLTDHT